METKQDDMFKCDWELFQLDGQRRPEALMTKTCSRGQRAGYSEEIADTKAILGVQEARFCRGTKRKSVQLELNEQGGRIITMRTEKQADHVGRLGAMLETSILKEMG